MNKYYWKNEDIGRVCATDFEYPPSRRWYSITEENYNAYEQYQKTACPRCEGKGYLDYEFEILGKYCIRCKGRGKIMPRP